MPVVYEVNLEIERAVETAYREWLHAHVAQVLALPGFLDAQVFEVLEPAAAASRFALCVHYRLRDQAALRDYLDRHAARMREDGLTRFGDRFSASRRVLLG